MNNPEKQHEKRGGNPSDYLANERTFLAWIRTAIAIMAFGFVVVKFSLFIKQLSFVFTEKAVVLPGNGYSGLTGVSMVIFGAVIALLAYFRYKHIEKQLKDSSYYPSSLLILLVTFAIVTGSIFLVLYLLPNL